MQVLANGFPRLDASHFRPVVYDMSAALRKAEMAASRQRQLCAIMDDRAASHFAARPVLIDLEQSVIQAEEAERKAQQECLPAKAKLWWCTKEFDSAVSAYGRAESLAREIQSKANAVSASLEQLQKEHALAKEKDEKALQTIPVVLRNALLEHQTKQRHDRTGQIMRADAALRDLREQLQAINLTGLETELENAKCDKEIAQQYVENNEFILRSAQEASRLAAGRVEALNLEIRATDHYLRSCLATERCKLNALERHRLSLEEWAVRTHSSPAARRWWYS